MLTEQLHVYSRSLTRQDDLFATLLGLPVEEHTANRLALRVGHARLVFEREATDGGPYHYALGVPGHRFPDAVAWLEARVPLLTSQAGQREFLFNTWSAAKRCSRTACGCS